MSRIFGWMNRRPKRVRDIVRFKESPTADADVKLVAENPPIELPETDVSVATEALNKFTLNDPYSHNVVPTSVDDDTPTLAEFVEPKTAARHREEVTERFRESERISAMNGTPKVVGNIAQISEEATRKILADVVENNPVVGGHRYSFTAHYDERGNLNSLNTVERVPAQLNDADAGGRLNAINRAEERYSRMEITATLHDALNGPVEESVYRLISKYDHLAQLLAVMESENFHTEYKAIQARYNVPDIDIYNAGKELGVL